MLTQVGAPCENPVSPSPRIRALFCMHIELELKVKIGYLEDCEITRGLEARELTHRASVTDSEGERDGVREKGPDGHSAWVAAGGPWPVCSGG